MITRSFGRETKYQKVLQDLERLAYGLQPEERLPSLRDLAANLDAGLHTVSGALRELEVQNVVYRRHGVGVFVSPRRTCTVWMVCSPSYFSRGHSPFWDAMVQVAYTRATAREQRLNLHFAPPLGHRTAPLYPEQVADIESGRVQGVVGIGLEPEDANWFLERDIPYTSFAGWAPYRARLDEQAMVELGVRALARRRCRHLAMLIPAGTEQRMLGRLRSTLHSHTGGTSMAGTSWIDSAGGPTPDPLPHQGYRLVRRIFSGPGPHPDGLLSTDENLTAGALMALARLGLQPGREVHIATHASRGMTSLTGCDDQLVRIEYDLDQLVHEIFSILETLMRNEQPTDFEPYADDCLVTMLKPRLVDGGHNLTKP